MNRRPGLTVQHGELGLGAEQPANVVVSGDHPGVGRLAPEDRLSLPELPVEIVRFPHAAFGEETIEALSGPRRPDRPVDGHNARVSPPSTMREAPVM